MIQRPDFHFLTNFSDEHFDRIDQRPPFASAIQSFETCLFLISINRFPSALTCCAMAIESAWKAATNAGQENKSDFATILGEVNNFFPSSAPSFNLKDFRKLRNDVVHFGYSPKDDEVSARMIFATGIPVFFLFVKSHLSLFIDLHSCIEPDLGEQLNLTLELNKIGKRQAISTIESSVMLRHMIKRMNSNLTIWQESALDDHSLSQQIEFEAKSGFKDMLLKDWHCSEAIRCPVCEWDDLVVRFEENQLSEGNLTALRAHCVNCDLNLPPAMLNQILERILSKDKREEILSSYGITPNQRATRAND